MRFIRLFACIFTITYIASLQYTILLGNKKTNTPLKFYLDFAFDSILINENEFKCREANGCRYLDSTYEYTLYKYDTYGFRRAMATFIFSYDNSGHTEVLELPIQIGKYPFNVVGINPYSIIRDSLSNLSLLFDSNDKSVKLCDHKIAEPLDIIETSDGSSFYLKAIVSYSMMTKYDRMHITHKNYANICFHDLYPTNSFAFFIAGNFSYIYDWYEFLNNYMQMEKDIKSVDYKITSIMEEESFSISYSNDILKNYSKPFRYYQAKYYDHCELYIGDYALEQSKLMFIVSKNPNNSYIDVRVANRSDSWSNILNLGFIFIVIMVQYLQ